MDIVQEKAKPVLGGKELAFRYLMLIGMVNALIAVIKVLERLPGAVGSDSAAVLTKILGLAEPYGKVIASAALFIAFQIIFKKRYPDEQATLLNIWGIVFVGIQIYYYIEVNFYERILQDYLGVASSKAYNAFYTGTHGFKYTPMFVGIMFGFMMTGIILHDRLIKFSVLGMCILYLIFFSFRDMAQLSFRETTIGIVLSSAFFHAIQTVGVFILGMYLEIKYVKN